MMTFLIRSFDVMAMPLMRMVFITLYLCVNTTSVVLSALDCDCDVVSKCACCGDHEFDGHTHSILVKNPAGGINYCALSSTVRSSCASRQTAYTFIADTPSVSRMKNNSAIAGDMIIYHTMKTIDPKYFSTSDYSAVTAYRQLPPSFSLTLKTASVYLI